MSVYDFTHDEIFRIAQRRANALREPIMVYGFVNITTDAAGDFRVADNPGWILRTELENKERGEPRGHLWDVVEPQVQRWRLTARSQASLEEIEELSTALEERYELSLENRRYLRSTEMERPVEPRVAEEYEVIRPGQIPEDAKDQIIRALADLTADSEVFEALSPYFSAGEKDESGMYIEPPGSPRVPTSRFGLGTRAKGVTAVLDRWIWAMLESEGQIDKEGLKQAFLQYLVEMHDVDAQRRAPEVAMSTIAMFSWPAARGQTVRGSCRLPRWEGAMPESLHARFYAPDDPRHALVRAMAEQWLENLEAERVARRKAATQKKREMGKEFFVKTHGPTGTVTAGTRKRKPRKKVR